MSATAAVVRAKATSDDPRSSFLADCLQGLRAGRKSIPCKWLYDEEGSRLFECICATPEYYLSRIEVELLTRAASRIADVLAPDTALVEFGSGASRKTRILLDGLVTVSCYVPVDISEGELARAVKAIEGDYPWLEVVPVAGDFANLNELGPALMFNDRLGFFPGSTLGNFAPDQAIQFLASVRSLLGHGSRLLLGMDLAKSEAVLRAAYDDREGVTAAFNKNVLARANRELGANFDVDQFYHRAVWNAPASRVEMHLVSRKPQTISLAGDTIHFAEGEAIHTENSYKFTKDALIDMTDRSGWQVEQEWLSAEPAYLVMLLRC